MCSSDLPDLPDLDGLGALTTGTIEIVNADGLRSLEGMGAFEGSLWISDSGALPDLTGLERAPLTLLQLQDNGHLQHLTGLDAATDIDRISIQDNDNLQTALKQTEAELASAQAALQSSRVNLDFTQVKAPITGRIGRALVLDGAHHPKAPELHRAERSKFRKALIGFNAENAVNVGRALHYALELYRGASGGEQIGRAHV